MDYFAEFKKALDNGDVIELADLTTNFIRLAEEVEQLKKDNGYLIQQINALGEMAAEQALREKNSAAVMAADLENIKKLLSSVLSMTKEMPRTDKLEELHQAQAEIKKLLSKDDSSEKDFWSSGVFYTVGAVNIIIMLTLCKAVFNMTGFFNSIWGFVKIMTGLKLLGF